MKNTRVLFSVVFSLCFVIACKKMPPQLPANKNVDDVQNTMSMMEINHQLALREDSLLQVYVANLKDKSFRKTETGLWYKIEKTKQGKKIKNNDVCQFSYELFSLDDKLLEKNEQEIIVIGKKQTIKGLEEGLQLLRKGDNAIFIIPWYLAYGMKGKEPLIAPYVSVIYRVKVFE
ncbi:MAG TPA: FKBP-type peptidyl-prolyl cis-trans isomerase [Paludibacteraceae bacterium]|nr:FKBP-type peptidyl-prolyl cis-trans isomerase [Paludibacteraceae bacterium]HPO67761.1 FKBP-type peptidyl-prolyl cis-trans isomerase [Paludibacteraceae bacterium]